jgi:hypothetical protein
VQNPANIHDGVQHSDASYTSNKAGGNLQQNVVKGDLDSEEACHERVE